MTDRHTLVLMPPDLLGLIFAFMSPSLHYLLRRVCKHWAQAISAGTKSDPSAYAQAKNLLDWATSHGGLDPGLRLRVAIEGGRLEVVQWARACVKNCMLSPHATAAAASKGHLDVLKWLREEKCPWDTSVYCGAAAGGHLSVLEWLDVQERPPHWHGREMARSVAMSGDIGVLEWLVANYITTALHHSYEIFSVLCKHGHLRAIEWLWVRRLLLDHWDNSLEQWRQSAWYSAIVRPGEYKGTAIVEWMMSVQPHMHIDDQHMLCSIAASTGRIDMLKYLRQRTPPVSCNEETFAALCGAVYFSSEREDDYDLSMLDWLEEQGCPWDESAYSAAAACGNAAALKWLHARRPIGPQDRELFEFGLE